jgi:hypothetical protein
MPSPFGIGIAAENKVLSTLFVFSVPHEQSLYHNIGFPV